VLTKFQDYASLQGHEISSDHTDSDETWEQITAWMKSCKSHETCTDGSLWQNKTAKVMPTRLLELAHGESHPLVKLVKTAHIKVADISYATLSHCWGSSLPVKLLTSLVEDFSSGISWASLSRTFRDTIMTTLKLGIRYLWIDALCIIQDSNDDWTYEAASMAGVYTNSYLCIAADASEDGSKGLFRQRSPNRLRSFIVPHQKSAVNRSGSVIYTDRWWTSVLDSPLASRAWSVQERFLAPRVLHFADEEVHWECTRLFTAESLPVSFNTIPANKHIIRKSLLQLDLPAEHRKKALYQTWYQLVSTYSSGELTFTSDRPIAIAGLARIFCQLLELPDSAYLCGIFRPRLEHDLMWYSQFKWTTPPETIRVADVPSWSWLSICARIWIYTGRLVGDTDTDSLITAEVVHAISTPCHDVFGPVTSSELTLRAPLCQTIIRRDDRPFAHDREDHTYVIHVNGSLLREDEHFMFRPDDTTDIGMCQILDTPVYLLLGRSSEPRRIEGSCHETVACLNHPS
jgi:hypothetical protein